MQIKSVQDIVKLNDSFQFPTMQDQERLVTNGLATKKEHDDLVIYKYHRNVMYKALWWTDPALMECRGHVYDKTTGELVVAAPRKSFNYGEFGWWSEISNDTEILADIKRNGFLGNVSSHNGKVICSTTGSLNSEYVELVKKHHFSEPGPLLTYSYEIVDRCDPHIVHETVGGHILNSRSKLSGKVNTTCTIRSTISELIDQYNDEEIEGFMVYHPEDVNRLCPTKLKTAYYVAKKKLMRASKGNINTIWQSVDSYGSAKVSRAFKEITKQFNQESWVRLDEQYRRKLIEFFEKE